MRGRGLLRHGEHMKSRRVDKGQALHVERHTVYGQGEKCEDTTTKLGRGNEIEFAIQGQDDVTGAVLDHASEARVSRGDGHTPSSHSRPGAVHSPGTGEK